jgi:flavoprotein
MGHSKLELLACQVKLQKSLVVELPLRTYDVILLSPATDNQVVAKHKKNGQSFDWNDHFK